MEKNIWKSFDFGSKDNTNQTQDSERDRIDKAIKEHEKNRKIQEDNNKYFQILKNTLNEKIGNLKELSCEYNDGKQGREGISILINRSNISTIYLAGEYWLIMDWSSRNTKSYKFNNYDFYKQYISQIIDNDVVPMIKEYYKRGDIRSLKGTKFEIKEDFNIKIEENVFEKMFNDSTSEESNSEKVQNIKIEFLDDKTTIEFDVDCNRYGIHHGEASITLRGNVRVWLPEILEDGGIEDVLEEKILTYIKK